MKPEPGARRYFFIPSPDGARWELAEAAYRRGAWDVSYPGHSSRDRFDAVPPPKADWVELVPPGRGPRKPWPPKPDLLRMADLPGLDEEDARPAEAEEEPRKEPKAKPEAKPKPARKAAVPKKAVPNLSKALGELLAEEQRSQKAPEGMVKCPDCGLALEPTRNKRVRTHDDPLKGTRCDASGRKWAEFEKPRPPRPKRA